MKLCQYILLIFIFFINFAPSSCLHAAEQKNDQVQNFNQPDKDKDIIGLNYAKNLLKIIEDGNGQEDIDLLAGKYPQQYFKDYLNQKDLNLLHKAAAHYSIPHMQFLLNAGVDINQQDNYGRTALHYICVKQKPNIPSNISRDKPEYQQYETDIAKNGNRLTTAKFLIHNGANINSAISPEYGKNAILHTLVSYHEENNSEILKLIINNGANVNIRNQAEFTPLHYTENLDHLDLLINNGANPNALDYMNKTPLFKKTFQYLCHNQDSDENIIRKKIEKLILAGTDITIKAKFDCNPEPQTILEYLESQEIKTYTSLEYLQSQEIIVHKYHFLTKIQQLKNAIYQALNILKENEIMGVEDLQSKQLQIDQRRIRERYSTILTEEKK